VIQPLLWPSFPRWEKVLAACFVIVICIQMPQRVFRDTLDALIKAPLLTQEENECIFARDIAYRLRALGGDTIPVIASAPTTTTWMMYYGGMKGLGTLYWENLDGLKNAAHIYAARNDEEAKQLLRAQHVSFLVILSCEPFVWEYPILIRGLPSNAKPRDTFAARLADGVKLPAWATDIPIRAPESLKSAWGSIYDVREIQENPNREN
ncbi:MAG: hypothetical protein ABI615_02950, partial [Chthoniobacterales bacterium]